MYIHVRGVGFNMCSWLLQFICAADRCHYSFKGGLVKAWTGATRCWSLEKACAADSWRQTSGAAASLTLVCGAGTFWGTFPSKSSVVFYLLMLGLGTFVDFYLREIGPRTFVDLYLPAIGLCTTWSSSWTPSCWCSGCALLGLLPPGGLVPAPTSTCWWSGCSSLGLLLRPLRPGALRLAALRLGALRPGLRLRGLLRPRALRLGLHRPGALLLATISSAASSTGYDSLRDSNIPVFNGALADYREYRHRIKLYMGKMKLLKREAEGMLNMLGSLSGTAWKLMENYDLADAEKPDALDRILKVLDKAFEYDSRVQLPQDFDKFFTHLHRRPGQTLLQYVTDFDKCYRKMEDHKISRPGAVQGWHLMRRAGLTKE